MSSLRALSAVVRAARPALVASSPVRSIALLARPVSRSLVVLGTSAQRTGMVIQRASLRTEREEPFVYQRPLTSPKALHMTAITILTLMPLGLAGVNPYHLADIGLGLAIPLHFHIGTTSVIVDYVHTRPLVRAAIWALTGASVVTGFALTYFNLTDVGITGALRLLWKA